MCQPEWEGVWGRVDACVCMAEFLCCSPEMTTTFLISYNPIQIKIKKRILEWVAISVSRGSSWTRVWTCISCTGRQTLYLLSYCWRAYFLIVSFWLCININLFDEYMTCGSSKAKRDRKFIHSADIEHLGWLGLVLALQVEQGQNKASVLWSLHSNEGNGPKC